MQFIKLFPDSDWFFYFEMIDIYSIYMDNEVGRVNERQLLLLGFDNPLLANISTLQLNCIDSRNSGSSSGKLNRTEIDLLLDCNRFDRLCTVELAGQDITDEDIQKMCNNPGFHSVINFDLRETKVTENAMRTILYSAIGCKRQSSEYKYNSRYESPVANLYVKLDFPVPDINGKAYGPFAVTYTFTYAHQPLQQTWWDMITGRATELRTEKISNAIKIMDIDDGKDTVLAPTSITMATGTIIPPATSAL